MLPNSFWPLIGKDSINKENQKVNLTHEQIFFLIIILNSTVYEEDNMSWPRVVYPRNAM